MRDIQVKRIVPHDDATVQECYKKIVDMFPECVIIEDQHGTYRFQENTVLNHLFYTDRLDLNRIHIDACHNKFPMRDYALFTMLLGGSLSMFLDTFSERLWPVEDEDEVDES